MSKAEAVVKSVLVYPVKSCRGFSVPEAVLTPNGLRWDRVWVFVNSKGRMCSQRADPRLTLVHVDMPLEAFKPLHHLSSTSSFLVISAPGIMNDVVKIPLVKQDGNGSPNSIVTVWEWTGPAFDEGDQAADWFSRFLGKPCRLVRFNEESQLRHVNSDYVHARTYTIKFNDWYPFHLLSQESLDALNQRLSEPIPVTRFRPNFVVDGCKPFAEDLWSEIKIHDSTFHGGELCYRCKIPTVNEETGEMESEVTEILKTFRSEKILRPDKEKDRGRMLVCTNFVPDSGMAIRVGDPVQVLRAISYTDCVF